MNEVLLVTSAISPSAGTPFLKLTNATERRIQTLCGLLSWIKSSPASRIVLCDNTGTEEHFAGIKRVADKHGKLLETLVFKGDSAKTCQYGKGFGEGEIINHALAHSRLLAESRSFYKITGRIFVSNFDAVQQASRNRSVVFDLPMRLDKRMFFRFFGLIDYIPPFYAHSWHRDTQTVVYKCRVDYFKRHLSDAFLSVNDAKGQYLEHAFYSRIVRHGFSPFKVRPRLIGRRGTTGNLYAGEDYPPDIRAEAEALAV